MFSIKSVDDKQEEVDTKTNFESSHFSAQSLKSLISFRQDMGLRLLKTVERCNGKVSSGKKVSLGDKSFNFCTESKR